MQSLRAAGLCLLALLPLSVRATGAPAAAVTGSVWAATETRAFASESVTDLGRAAADTPMKLMVSLKLRNTSVLYAYYQHITTPGDSLFRHYLQPGQFDALYAPTAAESASVAGYLKSQGFSNISVSDNRTVIRFQGTVAQAETAFATEIHSVGLKSQTAVANVRSAQVPAALGKVVGAVVGLNTIPRMHLAGRTVHTSGVLPPGPPSLNSIDGYTPQNLQTAYDVDPATDGSTANIAIIAEGDLSTVLTDLRAYEKMYSLPQVTYTVIPVGFDHTDTSGADEFDLDTQLSTGIANNVKNLYIYDGAALDDVELIDEYNHFVNDDLAEEGSASIAGCESLEYEGGELSAYDQVFLQMATQGQTLFNSTGDSGSSCLNPAGNGIPAGVPGVEYPASSPYVVGVGGTTLLVNADFTYNYEIAWYSGGGGLSVFEDAPSWQLPVLPLGAVGTATGVMTKGLPDMAMVADPNTGAEVIVAGAAEEIGGTSLASPLAMGSWARIQAANGNALGFAPPDLYAMASAPLTAATGFNDVILGTNVGYAATPGWDYTTGLGSFDIAAISKLMKNIPQTFSAAPSTFLGGSPCAIPGDEIAHGVMNSEIDEIPADNVLNVYVAEPYTADPADDTFVFTVSAQTLATIPPNTAYLVYFFIPNGTEYYVAYEANPASGATSNYTYGTVTLVETASLLDTYVPTQVGYADSGSLDTTNGLVEITLSKSKITGYAGNTPLTRVYGEADLEVTPIADNLGQGTNEILNDTPQGNYNPIGNQACPAVATTTGGTSGGTTTGGTSTGATSGGTTSGTSTGGTSSGGTSGGTSTGGTSTGGSSTGGTSTGGTSSGGASSGSSSGGSSTGGTSTGASSTGGTSGGTTTGGTSTGATSGGTTSGTSTGGTSSGGASSGSNSGGSSTGGTSTGASSTGGSSSGGTSGGSTAGGSATGGTTGGSSSGGTSTGGTSTGGSTTGTTGETTGGVVVTATAPNGSSGAMGISVLPVLGLAAVARRRRRKPA